MKTIEGISVNTINGQIYVYLIGDYKRKLLKYFLNYKGEKVFFIGTNKNKVMFNSVDTELILNYLS